MNNNYKVNIDQETHHNLNVICLVNGITQKEFVSNLVKEYLKKNKLPDSIKLEDLKF